MTNQDKLRWKQLGHSLLGSLCCSPSTNVCYPQTFVVEIKITYRQYWRCETYFKNWTLITATIINLFNKKCSWKSDETTQDIGKKTLLSPFRQTFFFCWTFTKGFASLSHLNSTNVVMNMWNAHRLHGSKSDTNGNYTREEFQIDADLYFGLAQRYSSRSLCLWCAVSLRLKTN